MIFILLLFIPLIIAAIVVIIKKCPPTNEPDHNQNGNGDTSLPQTFASFFTDIMTLMIQRYQLSEETWRKIQVDKQEREKVVKLIDKTVDTYYPRIDMTKGDDFMPENAYEYPPWYTNTLGFQSLLNRLIELTQVYMYRESKYYQSTELRNTLDAIVIQIMSKFPEEKTPDEPQPWNSFLWLIFAKNMPCSLLLWILARNSYISTNLSSDLIDTPHFTTKNDIDKVDRIAGELLDKLYSYPDSAECAKGRCFITSLGKVRADSMLLSLPWLISRILKTLFNTPCQIYDLLTSFKLSDQAIQNSQIKEDLIVYLLKPYFKNTITNKLYTQDELSEELRFLPKLFRDGTVLYRHMRFDFQIALDVQLDNQLVGKLLLPKDNWIATDNLLRKCAFSKMETPFLTIHPSQYYINTHTRSSTVNAYGEYGAFCMNISAFMSMKQQSWSFCYRGQKLALPIIIQDGDKDHPIVDLLLYSKEMLDKYSSAQIDFNQYLYKPGIVRSSQTRNKILTAITADNNKRLFATRAEALTVHLNDSLEHAATGLITTFQFDYDQMRFLPVEALTHNHNQDFPSQPMKYIAQEFILVTQYGVHICILVNYNEDIVSQPEEERIWVGLGHTYNTYDESRQIKTVTQNQTYQVGSTVVHLVAGFMETEIGEFTDTDGVIQYGLRGLASTRNVIAYSILHNNLRNDKTTESSNKSSESTSPPFANELTKPPTMTRADSLKQIEATFDTTDWTLYAKNGNLYLFDKQNKILKIGLPVPTNLTNTVLISRAELRNVIGDETTLKYRVRSRSDALLPTNYAEPQNKETAKTDVAPLDNPKADANDQTVNYKIAIRLDEAYPDLRMDQLSNKQKLLEYERSAYEVRVDEVPMFPKA